MIYFVVEELQNRGVPNARTVPQPEDNVQVQVELLVVGVQRGNEKLKRQNVEEKVGPGRILIH